MHRTGNARANRRAEPQEPIRLSQSGVHRRSVLSEEIGAIRDLFGAHAGGLHWLLTQPARCTHDAARVAMTADAQGIVLRCPRCQRTAMWNAPR